MADSRYQWLYIPGPDECENLEGYQVGGFHPVEIGDQFCAGKYTIVHKLGAGSGATVWLAQATNSQQKQYVALKILMANNSKNDSNELLLQKHLQRQVAAGFALSSVALLLDSFSIEGPNGKHLCLVFELAGPSLSMVRRNNMKIELDIMQILALQTAQGLKELHDAGVVYGDLGSNNVLLRVVDMNSWTIDELYERLGHPVADAVEAAEGRTLDEHVPKSVYLAIGFLNRPEYLKPEIAFVDLADGRLIDGPPREKATGWSLQYTAPETLWFQDMQTEASDIWALACIWYELRSAEVLFEAAYRGLEGIQWNIIDTIGEIPGSWAEKLPAPEDVPEDGPEDVSEDGPEDVSEDGPDGGQEDGPEEREELLPEVARGESADEAVAQEEQAQSIQFIKSKLRKAWFWVMSLFRKPETVYDPESPPVEREMDDNHHDFQPIDPEAECDHDDFNSYEAEQADESLHSRINRIGTSHEWFTLTLEGRVARMKEYSEEEYGHITTADVDDVSPPGPLSEDEKADFEDLLSSILKYKNADRMALEDVLVHPWFKRQYNEPSNGAWLREFSFGWKEPVHVMLD